MQVPFPSQKLPVEKYTQKIKIKSKGSTSPPRPHPLIMRVATGIAYCEKNQGKGSQT